MSRLISLFPSFLRRDLLEETLLRVFHVAVGQYVCFYAKLYNSAKFWMQSNNRSSCIFWFILADAEVEAELEPMSWLPKEILLLLENCSPSITDTRLRLSFQMATTVECQMSDKTFIFRCELISCFIVK
ncbi:hypothetical protein AVEN_84154-1 [Araneus ventricosus]|uniref:Uncharacterized protein n=1 Tax=Araneus ventricosus TaxID=182803 RepID=A0A4Y2TF75_ARAVE|nr:hypothetical protein AVEN_84154-1 [Araneus ventricosus]